MIAVITPSEKPDTLIINGLTKLNQAKTPALPNMVAAKINHGSGFFRKRNCSRRRVCDLSNVCGTHRATESSTSRLNAAIRKKV